MEKTPLNGSPEAPPANSGFSFGGILVREMTQEQLTQAQRAAGQRLLQPGQALEQFVNAFAHATATANVLAFEAERRASSIIVPPKLS
jgi:hypothetical protein